MCLSLFQAKQSYMSVRVDPEELQVNLASDKIQKI